MFKVFMSITLTCACIQAQVAVRASNLTVGPVNRVVPWILSKYKPSGLNIPFIIAPHSQGLISKYVSPFALLEENPFRPDSPSTMSKSSYADAFSGGKSLADGEIAFHDARYPSTGRRSLITMVRGDRDNAPYTVIDPNWFFPVGNTTPDPSYAGAHVVIAPFYFRTRLTTLLKRIL